MTFNLKNVSDQGILITWFNSGSQHSHTINSGDSYSFTADTLSPETTRLISLGMLILVTGVSPAIRVDTRIGVPIVYRGPYSPTTRYKTGNTTMFSGSLWMATSDQYGTSPVDNPDGWFNMVAGVDVSSHYTDYNNPHNTTADQVGALATTLLGADDGVAPLGSDGKIPDAYLPAAALGHVQNSDTKLAAGTGNEVTASALRAHLANTAGNPHGLTAAMISAVESSLLGSPLGVATLDNTGKLSASQIPTIDGIDVRIVANNAERDALAGSLGTNALVAVKDENNVYSWTGTTFTDATSTHAWTFFVNGKQGVSITLTTNDIAEANGKYYFTDGRLTASAPFQEVYTVRHTQGTDNILASGTINEVTAASIRAHIDSTGNPHSVTPSQIGAMENLSDDTTPQLSADLDATGHSINNVAAPVADDDAANKAYVDSVAVSGVSDGDKGDVVVSSGGTVWTVDNGVITFAKLQAPSGACVLGSDGVGNFKELSASEVLDQLTETSHGDILYRNGTVWTVLGAGTAGQALVTGGPAANPSWADVALDDGDYGDITVSSSGTVWTVDNSSITYAKMQDISASQRVLGRVTTGAGVTEELSVTNILDWLSSTHGAVLFRGASGWGAVGPGTAGQSLRTGGASADPYWADNTILDGTYGPITITSGVWSFTNGDYGDITITSGVLTIDNAAVTFAKIQNIATQRLVGRNTASTGVTEEVTATNVLDWIGSSQGTILYRGASGWAALAPGTAGHALVTAGAGADPSWSSIGFALTDGDKGDITVSSSGAVWTIDNSAITFAKIQDIATQRVVGRNTAGTGMTEEVTATNILDWLGSARGSILYRGGSGWTTLVPGTPGHALVSVGTGFDPAWSSVGNVVGPSSATDSAVALFDGTTGELIKNGALGTNPTTAPTLGLGTITDTTSRPFTISQTWNSAGLTATGLLVSITNTSSNTASRAFDVQVGGSSYFHVTGTGVVRMGAGTVEIGTSATTAGILSFWNNTSGSISVRTRASVALGTVSVYLPAVDGVELGFRTIPQNSQSSAYTTVLQDSGKHILHPSADTTARIFTIDSNANVPYDIGTAITFINQNGAGVLTISITSDTMRLAGDGSTGSRTLAANGIATAIKISATEWIISGVNLT